VALIFVPIQRAQAQSFNSTVLGAMVVARAAAVGGALVTLGPSLVIGAGLGLAAFYVYDKYVSPNATTLPSGAPVAQVNIDNLSRPLTPTEQALGFTQKTGTGQGVNPPNASFYPKLWTGTGPIPQNGPVNNDGNGVPAPGTGVYCSMPFNVWQTNVNGNAQFMTTQFSPAEIYEQRGRAYAIPSQYNTCYQRSTGDLYRILAVGTGPCPTGYGGSACTLVDSTAVVLPVDGTCQIMRSGNAFSIDNKDPDCTPKAGQSSPIPTFTNTNGTVSFISKPDSNGKPSVATVDVRNGVAAIALSTPNLTTDTYTTAIIQAAVPSATDGKAPITTITTVNTVGLGPAATQTSTSTSTTTPGEVKLDLPPNLAKTEDVNGVRDAVNDLAKAPTDPFSPDPKTAMPDVTESIKSTVGTGSSLPSIFSFSPALPSNVAAPPISFSLAGKPVSMDINAWIGYARNFLGVLLYILTPFLIFGIISGKKED
jgi:hypothetical protein